MTPSRQRREADRHERDGQGDDDHSSHHEQRQRAPAGLRRGLTAAVGVLVALTLGSFVRLWPSGYVAPHANNDLANVENVDATVIRVEAKPCGGADCLVVSARLESGPDEGQTITLPDMQRSTTGPAPQLDDRLVLSRVTIVQSGQTAYNYVDYQRSRPLWILGVAFAVFVVLVARWRGLAALVGLAVTAAVLVAFLIPALLNGESPLAVGLTSAAIITFVVLYIAHGVSARTTIALIGTITSLLLTGLLATVFTGFAHLTGLASEEIGFISSQGATVDAQGLLLVGTIIGTLGVLTDITVTQAAIVWEVHAANPAQTLRRLYRAGMRTGRDHIASTVYTLVLAYAGVSLPLLVLFTLGDQQFGDVVTSELVAEEVVRTLLGSIGLVASVPLTTFLAATVVHRPTAASRPSLTVPSLIPADAPTNS